MTLYKYRTAWEWDLISYFDIQLQVFHCFKDVTKKSKYLILHTIVCLLRSNTMVINIQSILNVRYI